MKKRKAEIYRAKVSENSTEIRHLPPEHNRSIAGKLSKYADKSTVKREDEEEAWEEQTAEEWRSLN